MSLLPKAVRNPRWNRQPTTDAYIPTIDNQEYPTGYANVNVNPGYVDSMKMGSLEVRDNFLGVALSHMFGLKAGLKEFGPRGEKEISKELTQLQDMDTYVPVDPSKLTRKQKVEALASLLFLTQK